MVTQLLRAWELHGFRTSSYTAYSSDLALWALKVKGEPEVGLGEK